MNTTDLGALIRLKRKEKGLNQKDFAAALHVSATAVNKWENGKNYPDLQNLQAISALLEIPVTEMLDGHPPSPTPTMPSLPEAIVPQLTNILESSDTAIPDIENTDCIEMPDTAAPQPEKASECLPSKGKRIRLKIAAPLLTSLFVGIVVVWWMAVGAQSRMPSFTVCDSYYGNYEGENAYYVITEFASEPTADDLLNYAEIIREKYGNHFSAVNQIVIIYVQDYADYMVNGFDDNTDSLGILYPLID